MTPRLLREAAAGQSVREASGCDFWGALGGDCTGGPDASVTRSLCCRVPRPRLLGSLNEPSLPSSEGRGTRATVSGSKRVELSQAEVPLAEFLPRRESCDASGLCRGPGLRETPHSLRAAPTPVREKVHEDQGKHLAQK